MAEARAEIALGQTREAIADLRRAVTLARAVDDPALFLRPATGLLAVDGDDALAAEAGAAVRRIVSALPDGAMRQCFEAAEPIRAVRAWAQ